MALNIATSQLINKFYDLYREDEVVFTNDIVKQLNLDLRRVSVKCNGSQWPCIINSTSFQMAKIIIGTAGGAFQEISKEENATVSLHYCFVDTGNQTLTFFVNCRVMDISAYMHSKDLVIITLAFTQQPPDDLIYRLGRFLSATANFHRRGDERILINDNSIRKLSLKQKEAVISVQGVPRNCILWNLFFKGAKVIIMGVAKFVKYRDVVLHLEFFDPDETILVTGKVVDARVVEGRTDLLQVNIEFNENDIPLSYKLRINGYLTTYKKSALDDEKLDSDTVSTQEAAMAAKLEK